MKKKFVKYIKFVISIFMICCLMFPSFSANDGIANDAYLTKEEFDIAISKFDNRLTDFEASVNSKIDAQVSTYLDRNGIWSGADEVFDGNPIDFITPEPAALVTQNHTTVNILDKTIVNKIKKQGLCCVKWRMRCPSPETENRSCLGYRYQYAGFGTTTAQNDINYDLVFSQGSDIKTIQALAKCNSIDGTGTTVDWNAKRTFFLFWYIPKNYYNGTSMFFVDKGSDLNIKIQMTYFFYNSAGDGVITFTAHESSTCEFQVTDVKVY